MDEQNGYKFVRFDKYCSTCEFRKNDEDTDPCYDCLASPVNLYSQKPINYKEDTKLKNKHERNDSL